MTMQGESASEFLMETMEQFSDAEGLDIVVIHTDANKTVHVRSNCAAVTAVGMAEVARHLMMKAIAEA